MYWKNAVFYWTFIIFPLNKVKKMYQFPFLLLTSDEVRNNVLADMINDELETYKISERKFIDELPDSIAKKPLIDLADTEIILTQLLLDTFRSRMNVLNSELPEIDYWRLKDKVKKLLTVMRRKSSELIHHSSDCKFIDLVKKVEMWEDAKLFTSKTPIEWNQTVLNRISDIHHNVHNYIETATRNCVHNQNPQIIFMSGQILEVMRVICREYKEYLRLIDSL